MVPLVVFMVWIGVHPNTFLKKMEPSVKHLVSTIQNQTTTERTPMVARVASPDRAAVAESTSAPDAAVPSPSSGPMTASAGGAQ